MFIHTCISSIGKTSQREAAPFGNLEGKRVYDDRHPKTDTKIKSSGRNSRPLSVPGYVPAWDSPVNRKSAMASEIPNVWI